MASRWVKVILRVGLQASSYWKIVINPPKPVVEQRSIEFLFKLFIYFTFFLKTTPITVIFSAETNNFLKFLKDLNSGHGAFRRLYL